MDAAAELGRNPVSKHQIQPEYGDEQADAGRNCRTRRLARPNSQARTGTGKYSFLDILVRHLEIFLVYPLPDLLSVSHLDDFLVHLLDDVRIRHLYDFMARRPNDFLRLLVRHLDDFLVHHLVHFLRCAT